MTILDAQQTFLVERPASLFYRFVVYLQQRSTTVFCQELLLYSCAPKEWTVRLVSLSTEIEAIPRNAASLRHDSRLLGTSSRCAIKAAERVVSETTTATGGTTGFTAGSASGTSRWPLWPMRWPSEGAGGSSCATPSSPRWRPTRTIGQRRRFPLASKSRIRMVTMVRMDFSSIWGTSTNSRSRPRTSILRRGESDDEDEPQERAATGVLNMRFIQQDPTGCLSTAGTTDSNFIFFKCF